MSQKLSAHKCSFCYKKLYENLYVVLSNFNNTFFKRLCYKCQKETYGMDFFINASTYDNFCCLYCNKNVFSFDFLNRKKYYLFTDMADSKKVLFCEACFVENSAT